MTSRHLLIGILTILGASGAEARAQTTLADSLLGRGALDRAESAYYGAVRARPHDPAARLDLGRYLAERGAPRVAATLMEEALQFGGERATIASDLAPIYLQIGDYRGLATVSAPALTPAEMAGARWLLTHPTRVVAPDTSLMMVFHQTIEPSGVIGHLPIRVEGRTLEAVVSTHVRGIVVSDTSVARRLQRFGEGSDARAAVVAVADSVGFGRLSIMNVPIAVEPSATAPAVVGIDVLAPFAPTFDPRTSRMTLRSPGTVAAAEHGAIVFPTLMTRDDFKILQAGGWASITTAQIARMLERHPWTYDSRRGSIIVEP
jgi:hypothetical protein